jgi:hypothetical protein
MRIHIRHFVLVFLVFTLSALRPALCQERDTTYLQLRNLKPGNDAVTVSEWTLHRDVAEFVFHRGTFYFLEPVAGKVVAAVFIGDGEFRMTPPSKIEKRSLAILTGQAGITEPFTEVMLHFSDNTYEEITKQSELLRPDPAGSRAAASFYQNRTNFFRKDHRFSRENLALGLLHYNLPARLLADIYDPQHAGFFNAYINGKKLGNLLFRIDPQGVPTVEPEEVVLADFDDDSLGIWTAFHVQNHTGSAVADEDHRLIDIEHYDVDATIKGIQLTAKVRVTARGLVDGPRVLSFDLYPTLRVTRVSLESGQALQFIQENKDEDPDLSVIFPVPLKKDSVYKIDFEYSGGDAIVSEGAGNYTLVARDDWYPATRFGERATFDMTFHTAKDLVMVASSTPVEAKQDKNESVTRWKSDMPLAVAGFNFGKFKKTESKDQKQKYVFESYANKEVPEYLKAVEGQLLVGSFNTTSLMDNARAEAQNAFSIYSNYFGELPYGRIAMTQQAAPDFGQAWPMLVYMPITAYFDGTVRHQIGLDSEADFFKIVAPHEVAHQWWGHIIGWKSYRDQWMSEGFAEFSASLYAHMVYNIDQFREFWRDRRQLILNKNTAGVRPADVGSVTMGYRINNARAGNVARNILYPKGAFILHMIRMMMYDPRESDKRFIEMMRDFVTTHYNQNVSTEDFKAIVEKHMTPEMDLGGNHSMDWFFDEYVYGTEIPRLKLDYQVEPLGNKFLLKLHITQNEVSEKFRMAYPITVETEDKKLMRLGVARLTGNSSQDATMTLPFRPRRVLLCLNEDVLANIDGR